MLPFWWWDSAVWSFCCSPALAMTALFPLGNRRPEGFLASGLKITALGYGHPDEELSRSALKWRRKRRLALYAGGKAVHIRRHGPSAPSRAFRAAPRARHDDRRPGA